MISEKNLKKQLTKIQQNETGGETNAPLHDIL